MTPQKPKCEHREWVEQPVKIPSAFYGCERTLSICLGCGEKKLEAPKVKENLLAQGVQ